MRFYKTYHLRYPRNLSKVERPMNYDVKKFGTLPTGKKHEKSHRKYPFEMQIFQIEKHLKIPSKIL